MNLIKECQGAKRIGISGHVRPDGDCVGACLALWQYLTKCLKEAQVKVFLEKPAQIFEEMKGYSEIDSEFQDEGGFDVFFALDTVPERMGEAYGFFQSAKKTINIDHHISNSGRADVNYIFPQVGSTCELIYDLVEEKDLDQEIAMCLYIGIIHDTGVFQYSNTTSDTLIKASHLISYGFDFPRLIEETFYQKTYVQSQIMGRAMMESIRFMDGKCIVSVIDRKTMEFYNATSKDFEGIVNQLRNIAGVECAIFMYETDTLEYKVSLRTTPVIDAAKVVSYFGGGGHMRAAGCTMKGNFYDCVNNLSLHIQEQLKRNETDV